MRPRIMLFVMFNVYVVFSIIIAIQFHIYGGIYFLVGCGWILFNKFIIDHVPKGTTEEIFYGKKK